MCGLAGVILGDRNRMKRELDRIGDLFLGLIVHSEHRGPFATGAALIKADGNITVEKGPLPSSEFVVTPEFRSLMEHMDSSVTCLMGHTRWPTRGTHLDNCNNHPLVSENDSVVLTHNGTITNADALFRRLKLPRTAEVDSEILLRLAERNIGTDGIELDGFIDDLGRCAGRLSIITVAASRPDLIVLLKGNQPLVIRFNHQLNLYAYASEPSILDEAGCVGPKWQSICLPAWHTLAIDVVNSAEMVTSQVRPYSAGGT